MTSGDGRVARWLNDLSVPRTLALAAVFLAAVASIDLATGPELSLSVFYLGPIVLIGWRTGVPGSLAASGAGAVTWYVVDTTGGHVYAHPLIPLWNALVRLAFFIIVCLLLVRLRQGLEREQRLARTDGLTGLLNHRAFTDVAARELDRATRTGAPVTFAYIDLDDFKGINDRLGHAAGDAVLRTVAGLLDLTLRTVDVKGRLGGDEFALLLPDTAREAAGRAVERLDAVLAAAGISCSIGAITFESPPADVGEALARVDALMYEVKADPGTRSAVRVSHHPGPALRAAG